MGRSTTTAGGVRQPTFYNPQARDRDSEGHRPTAGWPVSRIQLSMNCRISMMNKFTASMRRGARRALCPSARCIFSTIPSSAPQKLEHTKPPLYYNSAFLLRRDGSTAGVYRKMHLVPFGEYVPLKRLLFFVGPLVEGAGDFTAGRSMVMLPTSFGTPFCATHMTRTM